MHKAVIMVYLPGGPPHQDTFDVKTDAPADVRGEFSPISTNVPGVQICELLPRMAGMMDKLVPIRSVVGSIGDHASFQCLTGRSDRRQPTGGWPEIGSCIAKLQGGHSQRCRHLSDCRRGCSIDLTTMASRASLDLLMRRFSRTATVRTTLCCKA